MYSESHLTANSVVSYELDYLGIEVLLGVPGLIVLRNRPGFLLQNTSTLVSNLNQQLVIVVLISLLRYPRLKMLILPRAYALILLPLRNPLIHVKCIHELCTIILIFHSYLHHIRGLLLLFNDFW